MSNQPVKLSSFDLSQVYKPRGYCRKDESKQFLLFSTRYEITLADVLEIKAGYDAERLNGMLYSADNNFEAWFYDHCMARMERPVEALESFRLSSDPEVRGISIKALLDRYGVTEANRLAAEMAEMNKSVSASTRQTMWAMWVAAIATVVTAGVAIWQALKQSF